MSGAGLDTGSRPAGRVQCRGKLLVGTTPAASRQPPIRGHEGGGGKPPPYGTFIYCSDSDVEKWTQIRAPDIAAAL